MYSLYSVLVLLATVLSPVRSVFRLETGAFLKLPDQQDRLTFNNGAANKADYDPQENLLYVIGYSADVMHVVDMSDPANPNLLATKTFSKVNEGLPDSVKVCRGGFQREFLAVSFEAPQQNERGHVHFYQLLTQSTVNNDLTRVKDIVTLDSYDPRAMAWRPDCAEVMVVSQGQPHEINGVFEDPPADVEILVSGFGVTVDRQSVPIVEDDLAAAGIRQVFKTCDSVAGENPLPPESTREQDLEPKAVTVDQNNMAYIVFQGNNAIGKMDMNDQAQDRKIHYHDLGTKEWRQNALDGSYDDQAIALENRPGLHSVYQPSSIVSFELDGQVWLATADQGSIRQYSFPTCMFDESVTARQWNQAFTDALPSGEQSKLNADMNSNPEIGRLKVSKLRIPNDGWDNLLQAYDYVTAFGGRGFSIYDADNMNRVYDSGDFFERYFVNGSATSEEDAMFNARVGNAGTLKSSQRDRNSPQMGPAPSAIAVADWSNTTKVLLIANGMTGGVYVYSVSAGPIGPIVDFEDYIRRGNPALTWREAYDMTGDAVGEPEITDLLYFEDEGQKTVVAVSSTAGALSFYTLVEYP